MSTAGAGANDVEMEEEAGNNNLRRCAACKHLRRRCAHDCVLAPYFPASQLHRYACVHRVFGASNVARLLQNLPAQERGHAADTIAMEAQWRVQNPVYGCTGIINQLQDEIRAVQCELARARAQLAIIAPAAGVARARPPQQSQGQEGTSFDPDKFLDLDGV